MALHPDLKEHVESIFGTRWTIRDGNVVPDPDDPDLQLGNDGVKLVATALYADLADSTELVTNEKKPVAAEVMKAFLHCACKIIREKGGEIASFDGDRVMAVFIGETKNTDAVRAALGIHHIVDFVITPAFRSQYGGTRKVAHAVGIDTGKLLVARTGIRSYNDLVWVGRSANVAAKLSALRDDPFATFITKDVYNAMQPSVRLAKNGTVNMWAEDVWEGRTIYKSSWHWEL